MLTCDGLSTTPSTATRLQSWHTQAVFRQWQWPISSYGVKQYLPLMQDIIDQYNPNDPDPAKVEARMTTAGYSKDSEGFWTKDGERVEITLEIPSWMRPQGPFLEKQLQDGGFDAVFKQGEPATIGDRLRMGETEVVWVQCGSINEPYDTFKSYHSKNSAPPGENYAGAVQGGTLREPRDGCHPGRDGGNAPLARRPALR